MSDVRCGCNHLASQHNAGCHECLCPGFHEGVGMVPCVVHGRWELLLPEHRAWRPGWDRWEFERISTMRAHLAPGDVVFDIGAEEGDMSALWSSWGCRVVLVEANHRSWPWIRRTFQANNLEPAAWWVGFAADRSWRVDDEHRLGWSGWPDCSDAPDPTAEHGFVTPHEYADLIPGKTVDDLVGELRLAPDVLTIDVEGSEVGVLRGAAGTLRRHRPKVFCSVHPEFIRNLGQDPAELFDLMASLGYEAAHLGTDHEEHWLWS